MNALIFCILEILNGDRTFALMFHDMVSDSFEEKQENTEAFRYVSPDDSSVTGMFLNLLNNTSGV